MDVGQVHVVFVDASTGQAIGQTVMPLERLPASFATSTTMHIGGDDWNVVRAEPLTADEFGRTGELQLTLARIQRISPQAILYTMPSLWADLPPPHLLKRCSVSTYSSSTRMIGARSSLSRRSIRMPLPLNSRPSRVSSKNPASSTAASGHSVKFTCGMQSWIHCDPLSR